MQNLSPPPFCLVELELRSTLVCLFCKIISLCNPHASLDGAKNYGVHQSSQVSILTILCLLFPSFLLTSPLLSHLLRPFSLLHLTQFLPSYTAILWHRSFTHTMGSSSCNIGILLFIASCTLHEVRIRRFRSCCSYYCKLKQYCGVWEFLCGQKTWCWNKKSVHLTWFSVGVCSV